MEDHATMPGPEHRLLPSVVVLLLVAIPVLLPTTVFPRELVGVGLLTVGLLVAIVVGDPGRIDRRSKRMRQLSIALIGVLLLTSVTATGYLVVELVDGAPALDQPSTLLWSGALVWIDANLTFSLLYWELDGGGPAERHHKPRTYPDFAFPEHLSPHLAVPGWRPTFLDYLYLGFTNATAFSPTDIMPLRRWAKLAMAAQAMMSIVILSLVVANAVNLLG